MLGQRRDGLPVEILESVVKGQHDCLRRYLATLSQQRSEFSRGQCGAPGIAEVSELLPEGGRMILQGAQVASAGSLISWYIKTGTDRTGAESTADIPIDHGGPATPDGYRLTSGGSWGSGSRTGLAAASCSLATT